MSIIIIIIIITVIIIIIIAFLHSKELTFARAHATMLYVELLYDRHRKDIHIERNRRLLEKAKRIIQLEEQNAAMVSGELLF